MPPRRSALRNCGANGGGSTTVNRRGSAATCLSLPSVTDFRKSSTAAGLLCRVEIKSDRVEITLSRCRLTQLLAGSIDLTMQHQGPTNAPGDILRLSVPVGLKRVGREMRMLVENADDQTAADPSLLRIIARAHHIQARLIQNPKLTVHDIAREEQAGVFFACADGMDRSAIKSIGAPASTRRRTFPAKRAA
jgi:hypothetical protein